MGMVSIIDNFALLITIIIAITSLIMSLLSFRRSSKSVILRNNQNKQMMILINHTIILYRQVFPLQHTVIVQKKEIPPYLLASMVENAKRIDDALEKAISLDLLQLIVDLDRTSYSYELYILFMQGLHDAIQFGSNDEKHWLSSYILFGLIRLLDVCSRYPNSSVNKIASYQSLNDEMLDLAWKQSAELSNK